MSTGMFSWSLFQTYLFVSVQNCLQVSKLWLPVKHDIRKSINSLSCYTGAPSVVSFHWAFLTQILNLKENCCYHLILGYHIATNCTHVATDAKCVTVNLQQLGSEHRIIHPQNCGWKFVSDMYHLFTTCWQPLANLAIAVKQMLLSLWRDYYSLLLPWCREVIHFS